MTEGIPKKPDIKTNTTSENGKSAIKEGVRHLNNIIDRRREYLKWLENGLRADSLDRERLRIDLLKIRDLEEEKLKIAAEVFKYLKDQYKLDPLDADLLAAALDS